MSTSVDVTCSRCGTFLGNVAHMQDGWPLYEAHAQECTVPLTGAAWLGQIVPPRPIPTYTIVP